MQSEMEFVRADMHADALSLGHDPADFVSRIAQACDVDAWGMDFWWADTHYHFSWSHAVSVPARMRAMAEERGTTTAEVSAAEAWRELDAEAALMKAEEHRQIEEDIEEMERTWEDRKQKMHDTRHPSSGSIRTTPRTPRSQLVESVCDAREWGDEAGMRDKLERHAMVDEAMLLDGLPDA